MESIRHKVSMDKISLRMIISAQAPAGKWGGVCGRPPFIFFVKTILLYAKQLDFIKRKE